MSLFSRKPQTKTPAWTPEGQFVLPHADGTYDQPTVTIHAPIASELAERGAQEFDTKADAERLRAEVATRMGDKAIQSSDQ